MVLAPALPDLSDPGSEAEEARELVAALHQVLDRTAGADLSGDPERQGELVTELARAESRLSAWKLRVLEAAEHDRTARREGMASTDQWYASRTRTDRQQAAREVGLATGLRQRPATRDALAAGAISAEHARVITRADQRLPDSVSADDRDRVEQRLITQARSLSPGRLRRSARRALAEVEPDTDAVDSHEDDQLRAEERRAREKTRLVLHDNGDGTVTGRFTLPTFHGHLLQKVLETMTAPRRARSSASGARDGTAGTRGRVRDDGPGGHTDGKTDWARARGEAFSALLEHLPTERLTGRNAATVVVRIDQDVLAGALRAAGVDAGGEISSGEARRLACNAGILPAVLGGASQPLDLGRSRRLFTETQRTAVGLRHETCAARDCERPFAWTELHHRTPWSAGGKTDLREAIPLCHFHHQRIHDPDVTHREHPDGSVTLGPAARRTA